MKDKTERTPLLGSQERNRLETTRTEIPFPACRHVFVSLTFLATVLGAFQRVSLTIAIVSMVNATVPTADDNTTKAVVDTECLPAQQTNSSHVTASTGEFYWSKSQQGLILGSLFFGSVTTTLLGGVLAERFGGKHIVSISILGVSIISLLTPVIARTSYVLLIVSRVLQGVLTGPEIAALKSMLASWAPPYERTRLGVILFIGTGIGTVLGLPITGVLCDTLGWPSVFYIFGAIPFIWGVLWFVFVYNTPRTHPRISTAEKTYIEMSINMEKATVKLSPPWRKILTSMPFWAIAIAELSYRWGMVMILTMLPQFLNDILHLNISSNGVLSALPHVASTVSSIVSGFLVDYLRVRGMARTVVARKVTTAVGMGGAAVFLALAGHVGCQRALAVVMLVMSSGFVGIASSGYLVSSLDIAPRFAGTIQGLTSTGSMVIGMIVPLAMTALIEKENTRAQWQIVFYIGAAVYVLGATFFAIFASGEEQKWAMASSSDTISTSVTAPDDPTAVNEQADPSSDFDVDSKSAKLNGTAHTYD